MVSVRDLRNRGGHILDAVVRGRSVTITRDGDPVAVMSPLPRPRVAMDVLVARRRNLPVMDARALRADLDAAVDQSW